MLGFMLNLRDGFVAVPPKRLQAIFRDVNRLAHSHTPSVRRCASVLGRIRSLLFAMPHIRLLSDALAVHVAVAVQARWEADVALPERVSRQLMDLADELHQWKGRTFVVAMGHVRDMYSDASDLAWSPSRVRLVPESRGTHKRQRVQGSPTDYSSVCAEGHHAAIFHRLNGPLLVSPQVRGRKPRFNALILQLWNFTQANRIEIQPFYVHTSVNPADIWSRLRWTPSEATFPSDVLTWILEEFKSWIQPEIDWMSRSSNAVCSKFVSPCPQPGAYAIDVFSQNLTLLSPGWVFPPFKHIPQLVNKVLESPGVKVLMALSYRPREVWWNLLMKHVKFAVNTSEFRLQMPDGTETQPRFVLTLAYVCVITINCEELPTKRRRLSSRKRYLKRYNSAWHMFGTFLLQDAALAPLLKVERFGQIPLMTVAVQLLKFSRTHSLSAGRMAYSAVCLFPCFSQLRFEGMLRNLKRDWFVSVPHHHRFYDVRRLIQVMHQQPVETEAQLRLQAILSLRFFALFRGVDLARSRRDIQRAAQPWFISAKRKGRRYYARYPIHNVTPPSIDPQRCLARYLEATGDYEGSEIFVSLRKPRKPLSSDTINGLTTRWLRKHLLELGELETDSFSAHSTRGAAATALIYLGVDPHVVAALGDWSCYDTFRKFYDRTRALLRIAQVLVPPDLATGEAARPSRLAIN